MPDFREQLQKYFEAKELSAAKVEAILAEGRAAFEGKIALAKPFGAGRHLIWVMAACVVLSLGVGFWWGVVAGGRVSYAAVAPWVVDFFHKDPELPKRSQNPEELRAWLITQGAPAECQIPAKLRDLKSFGCQVLDVHGRPAYLACFWREKKPGVDEGKLVHLVIAHREDFKDPPAEVPQYREIGEWSFAAWTEGNVIYTLAANAPLEKLKTFVSSSSGRSGQSLLTAGMFGIRHKRG
jgi:hypothetical protein